VVVVVAQALAAVLMVFLVDLVHMHISRSLESHLELSITSALDPLLAERQIQQELMVVRHM
jgi:hypothetical protein